MKAKIKGLQKLTETEIKMNILLAQETITLEDISKNLIGIEKDEFLKLVTEKFNSTKGNDRDLFYKKIEPFTDQSTKNQLWQYNHNRITWAISVLIQEYGRMPTNEEIAIKTEISRQTVHKHLKEYAKDVRYLEIVEQFKFMSSKVLAKVFSFAVQGDVKAAKLYLQVVGNCFSPMSSNTINTQNNYLQINQMRLSQETIKELTPEQVNEIEKILTLALKNRVGSCNIDPNYT